MKRYSRNELKLEMRGKAQCVARPTQARLQNSGVIGPKFIKFLSDILRVIGGVIYSSNRQNYKLK